MTASRRPRVRANARLDRHEGPNVRPAHLLRADVACSAREEQLLTWLAELVALTETEGRATARLWHERIRAADGLSRVSSNRQWERLKLQLVEHGVPHEIHPIPPSDDSGEAPGAVAVVMLVGKVGLHRYAARLKRCKNPTCAKRLPPRAPFFHVDPTRADGLSRRCADCENAAARERFRRGIAAGKDPEQIERRRTTMRVASAARRARLKKLQRATCTRAISAAQEINSHAAPSALAGASTVPVVKAHVAPNTPNARGAS